MKLELKTAAAIALCWRILTAGLTRTFFQPDEFFQCLEVAHHVVFGYGHLTWEWRAIPPIRSILFPAIYMPVYWLLKVTGTDEGPALILAPKVLQGCIAAMTDIATFQLARKTLGEQFAATSFMLSLTSFFHLLSLGRTLSNSVETSITTTAMIYWPWHGETTLRNLVFALVLAATALAIRPPNAVVWTFLYGDLLWRSRGNAIFLKLLLSVTTMVGFVYVGLLLLTDRLYFGFWTFTPLNFLLTNMTSVSLFYGQNPWHYYLTQGLPILLLGHLPSFGLGMRSILTSGIATARRLSYLVIWTIIIYSLAGHKEWRFLHPILPTMLVIASAGLIGGSKKKNRLERPSPWLPIRKMQSTLILIGLVPSIYVVLFHSRAQIAVMSYLRSLPPTELRTAGLLMPCHSTPWQSHLHRSHLADHGRMWAIGCEPPLLGQNISGYRDQATIFYESPMTYVRRHFPKAVDGSFPPSRFPSDIPGIANPEGDNWEHSWPSHLVFFGALLENDQDVGPLLRSLGYNEVWSAMNGWEEDSRRKGGVRVWRWSATNFPVRFPVHEGVIAREPVT